MGGGRLNYFNFTTFLYLAEDTVATQILFIHTLKRKTKIRHVKCTICDDLCLSKEIFYTFVYLNGGHVTSDALPSKIVRKVKYNARLTNMPSLIYNVSEQWHNLLRGKC